MAAWRKEEVDAARHRQEKREATALEKVVIAHGSVEFCEATPFDLVDGSRESLVYGRETDRDLCCACRCVTWFLFYFLRTSSVGGGRWVRGQTFYFAIFSMLSGPRAGFATV